MMPGGDLYRTAVGLRWLALVAAMGVAATMAWPQTVSADAKTDYLVRSLETSRAFRVRAQAALSLGGVKPQPNVLSALGSALRDKHPAVRIAAISSLGRIKDPSTKSLLKKAEQDRERTVREAASAALRDWDRGSTGGDAKYYVAVDKPGAKAGGITKDMLNSVRRFLSDQVGGLEGVELASLGQSPTEVSRLLKERDLKGFIIQSSVAKLDQTGPSTRAEVSVILSSYPGREMRAMLRGAATVTGGNPKTRTEDAIQGAISGAMRRLPTAMKASR